MITVWHIRVQIPLDQMIDHHLTHINVYRIDSKSSSRTANTLTRAHFIILHITGSCWAGNKNDLCTKHTSIGFLNLRVGRAYYECMNHMQWQLSKVIVSKWNKRSITTHASNSVIIAALLHVNTFFPPSTSLTCVTHTVAVLERWCNKQRCIKRPQNKRW